MTTAQPDTPWQHLEKPTSRAIYDAAIDLFFEQGYEATSLRQVAERVGITVGSLYNHMHGKEELLFNIMRYVMIELIQSVSKEMESATDPTERVRRFMRTSIGFHATHPRETLIGNSELRALDDHNRQEIVDLRDRYERILVRALEEARDLGRTPTSNAHMTAYAGLAICSHVASWYKNDDGLSIDQVADALVASYVPASSG